MKHYAGLDVSMEETSICVLDEDGDSVREGAVPTEREAISAFLEPLRETLRRAALAAGSLTPWLCQALLAGDIPAICIETRHAKAAMQAQNVKTDRNDARGIAHMSGSCQGPRWIVTQLCWINYQGSETDELAGFDPL